MTSPKKKYVERKKQKIILIKTTQTIKIKTKNNPPLSPYRNCIHKNIKILLIN